MISNQTWKAWLLLITVVVSTAVTATTPPALAEQVWTIDNQSDWEDAMEDQTNLELKDGMATPTAKTATFQSKLKSFSEQRSAKSITISQSPVWQNWTPTDDLGPVNLGDAPVMLSLGPDNYWMFGRYGDWAAIAIGGQYYLFCDYDPAESRSMSVGWFTSPSINEKFTWCGNIGNGHPDPDIMFAEGKFYLATQQPMDFVSPGPWVEDVEVRVGVDTDNDASIDQWTDWTTVKETYDYTPGFAKQVAKTPASLDLSELPPGFGIQFEIKIKDTTENSSQPILDKIAIGF